MKAKYLTHFNIFTSNVMILYFFQIKTLDIYYIEIGIYYYEVFIFSKKMCKLSTPQTLTQNLVSQTEDF